MTVPAPHAGLFVVLEGPEGSGKTTQTARLARWLRGAGHAVCTVREPGGTRLGEAIRGHVWVRTDLEIGAVPELLLVSAARAALVAEVLRPALERGDLVLADRFFLSTLAYQGYGRGLPLDEIRSVTRLATQGLLPDLTLLLELPDHAGTARQHAAGKEADRMERQGAAFLSRVQQGYRELARSEPGIVPVDATGTVEEVEARLRAALVTRFPERFGAVTGEAAAEGGA
ncbi:MAG: dTMP kinase [Gemmatimonadetes bacterium]|nr:dTMP kinase [Gemmatimonadota bacterium]